MPQDALNRGGGLRSESFASILNSVLLGMPSALERLLYVAKLRNPESCDVLLRQFGLSGFSISEVDEAIWRLHRVIFANWLDLNLDQKVADLEEYASRQGRLLPDAANEWLEPKVLAALIPCRVRTPEMRLFLSDAQMLLTTVAGKTIARS